MKKFLKSKNGITLISLVVTIIILLILTGISISMLSGNNGILRQAGNAKKETDIAEEKELLQTAVLSAISKEKYGDMNKDKLDDELDKMLGSSNYSSELVEDVIAITFIKSGRTYIVDSSGNVEKISPKIKISESKVVINANGTGEDVTANSKTEGTDLLYISFKATIPEGTITSVIYNENPIMPQDGIYVLEISKNGEYNFTINATLEGENISTPYIKVVDKYELRAGINVGDYVTYVPPKNSNGTIKSYELTAGASGYTSNQTITQQYNIWRVLNKNSDGTLDIMPAYTDGVTYTKIYFKDAKGWNNAPYLLDDMCRVLYEATNEETKKAITVKSIDYEDITSHMIEGEEGETSSNSTGLKKISKYQSEQVAKLSTGTDIESIDKKANMVTYKNGKTSYPLLYPNVKNDESNPYYTAESIDKDSLSNGRITEKPENLQLKYTDYNGEILLSDCLDRNLYDLLFGTFTVGKWKEYWIASRCVLCDPDRAMFGIRYVSDSYLKSEYKLYYSTDICSDYVMSNPICPIVTIGSDVQVTKCTGTNEKNNRHIVVIPN